MRRAYNSFARLGEGVFRFSGAAASSGLRVVVAGGVHGNERIGVEVLDHLRLALLGASPLAAVGNTLPLVSRGDLTLVYGNPRAIRVGKRGSEPHADLNRCFPIDLLSSEGERASYEEQRAKELAPVLARADLLLDIHSTNKPSEPFVRLAGHAKVSEKLWTVTSRLPCDIVLHDPRHLIGDGHVALTDEFVGAHGGLGVCFESGLASDLSTGKIDAITRGVVEILTADMQAIDLVDAHGQITAVGTPAEPALTGRRVFEITQLFKLTERGFRWADGVGETNFQRVAANEPIGFVGADEPFAVPYDAHIVFPKVAALWKLGAYVVWCLADLVRGWMLTILVCPQTSRLAVPARRSSVTALQQLCLRNIDRQVAPIGFSAWRDSPEASCLVKSPSNLNAIATEVACHVVTENMVCCLADPHFTDGSS